MTVKQLISELLQFPMDLDVTIIKDGDACRIRTIEAVINEGEPHCGIRVR